MVAPLVILSGPSGSGKSTVIEHLLKDGRRPMRLSVSATTRQPRPRERDGVHYHFWTRERYEKEIAAGGFLEWAEVYGKFYGTPRSEVEPYRARGIGVILDIDVQGAKQVRRQIPDALSIFLVTPTWEDCERRLRLRHTESEAELATRLATARREMEQQNEYDHVVVNDKLEVAVAMVRDLISARFP